MPGEPQGGSPGHARYLVFAVLALALLMWALVPVTLLLPPLAGQRGWTTAALLVVGEAALPGQEVVRRHRSYLDPRRLFREGP